MSKIRTAWAGECFFFDGGTPVADISDAVNWFSQGSPVLGNIVINDKTFMQITNGTSAVHVTNHTTVAAGTTQMEA